MTTITMFDSVDSHAIPVNAPSAAGYVGGRFPDFFAIAARFPHLEASGRLISIAVTAEERARCLDVETGDATPAEAAAWVKDMLKLNVWKPALYANMSTMPAVRDNLQRGGLKFDQDYRLWVADWTGEPHIPAPFHACQWTDKGKPNDDISLCRDTFFPPENRPGPHGICHAYLTYDLGTDHWHVVPRPGSPHFTSTQEHDASAEIQINTRNGRWRVHRMPHGSPPLGGK